MKRPCDDCRMAGDCPHADDDTAATCYMQGEHPAVALLRQYMTEFSGRSKWEEDVDAYLSAVEAQNEDDSD